MIQHIYHLIPEKYKLCGDIVAGVSLIGYWLDKIQGAAAALASIAALVYTVVRAYYYIKDRRAGKKPE